MPVSINVEINDAATSMTILIDDGSNEIKSVCIPIELKSQKETRDLDLNRPVIDEIFSRFIETGDVSEIREVPDFKKVYKHYVFAYVKGMNGRTMVAEKAAGMNKIIHGVMPAKYWDQETVSNLDIAAREGKIKCVIFGDGTRPFIVNDIMFLGDEWEQRGRLFNSLYAKPRD